MARVEAFVGPPVPGRGRQSYLARHLVAEHLFSSYEEAFAFADSYYALVKGGPISQHLLWDWE